jgi:hypothetical protein
MWQQGNWPELLAHEGQYIRKGWEAIYWYTRLLCAAGELMFTGYCCPTPPQRHTAICMLASGEMIGGTNNTGHTNLPYNQNQ